MKVAFLTLGCKVNQYEADSLAQTMEQKGYQIVDGLDKDVDLVFLSTCAVTNEAERKSRQMVAKINKECPKAKIFVCGCASQHSPKDFESKNNVSVVVGASGKQWLTEMLEQSGCFVVDAPYDYENIDAPKKHRTRSYLKIQDGCNNYCTYCIIPYLRGRSRSRGLESIIVEAFNMAKASKEIVITGIDVSSWGEDIQLDMLDLVESLKTIKARIRFSSMEAKIITPEFLKTLQSMPNFCPHFHLSMQSGCDNTLKTMNRKYTVAEFLNKVEMIHLAFPQGAITTDLIVGFPNETEEDFVTTMETIKKAKFADIHIFPYSRRAGTAAARLPLIDGEVVKERVARVTKLRDELYDEFLKRQIGTIQEVLIEQEIEGKYLIGHSANFTKIYIDKNTAKTNELVIVKVKSLLKDGVLAEVVKGF